MGQEQIVNQNFGELNSQNLGNVTGYSSAPSHEAQRRQGLRNLQYLLRWTSLWHLVVLLVTLSYVS